MPGFRKILVATVGLAVACLFWGAAPLPWAEDLELSGGGDWPSRVGIEIRNATLVEWHGRLMSVDLASLPLSGERVGGLRVTSDDGRQLRYAVQTIAGKDVSEDAVVPSDGSLIFPMSAKPGETNRVLVYFGNALAGNTGEQLDRTGVVTCASANDVMVGAVERTGLAPIGWKVDWPEDAASRWAWRVPFTVYVRRDETRPRRLVAIRLAEALRAHLQAEFAVTMEGRRVDGFRLGDWLLFENDSPAGSAVRYYVYVGLRMAGGKRLSYEMAQGSDIPSDNVLRLEAEVSDAIAYSRIVNSSLNMLTNRTCFVVVSPEAADAWNGRTFSVPVHAGRAYLLGAFFACSNLTEKTNVYCHLQDALGKPTASSFGTQPGISGTRTWTPTFATFVAPPATVKADLCFTTAAKGELRHRDMLFCEYLPACVGVPECPPCPIARKLHVGAIDTLVKVFPETQPPPGGHFAVSLARHETENMQLAVRADWDVGELTADLEPPVSETGQTLSVSGGWVAYVPIDRPSSYYSFRGNAWETSCPRGNGDSDGWPGLWPDPIVPGLTVTNVIAAQTRSFWLTVKTTGETPAGIYRGKIVWRSGGSVVRTDLYEVTVWNFTLNEHPRFAAFFDATVRKTVWRRPGEPERSALGRLWKFMAEKKISPFSLHADVVFSRDENGRIIADFTAFDEAAAEYFNDRKFPMAYLPDAFYCFGWGMPPKKFMGEEPYEGTWPYAKSDRRVLRPAYRAVFQEALRLFIAHVELKGWKDRFVLMLADEPHYQKRAIADQIEALCKMFHEVSPDVKIYASTWGHLERLDESLDVWGAGHANGFPVETMSRLVKSGKSVWFTTDGQFCIDTPMCAVERLLPHYAANYGASAYEFWGANWTTHDPWKYGWHAFIRQSDTPGVEYRVRYPSGDGYVLYPPLTPDGDYVSTIRLEAIRDGVEDYEYLILLRQLADRSGGKAKQAKSLLDRFRTLVPHPAACGRYSTLMIDDASTFSRLRLEAGSLLSSESPR